MRAHTLHYCALLATTLALPALAGITTDEARALVAQAMAVPTETVHAVPSEGGLARFDVATPRGPCRCMVDLDLGQFVGYMRPFPDVTYGPDGQLLTPLTISEESAREVALAEARRLLGAAFEAIPEWQTRVTAGGTLVRVSGKALPAGDPPREGLTPYAWADVSLVEGAIVAYLQLVPAKAEPVAPRVTAEEATRTALADWGVPQGKPDPQRGAMLCQDSYGRGELWWWVAVRALVPHAEKGPDGQDHTYYTQEGTVYKIDALSGEVLEGGTHNAPPPPAVSAP